MKTTLPNILFVLILITVSYFYNYHKILFKRPQSIHAWRQADNASMALNYSREGMNFFQPSLHNLTSDGGTSGKSATSEMPLLTFTVAALYKIFGKHEFIFRLLNMFIFFLGLYYLFKTIRMEIKDNFWATTIPLFLFTSPVLLYYGNNFLSNTSAFSLVLVGWYFVFRYFRSHSKTDLQKIFIFFLLAGALKITALFSFFALGAIFFLEWSGKVKFNKSKKLFPHSGLTVTGAILMIIPIGAWILYARHYNQVHQSSYFSTVLFPIWNLETDTIRKIITAIKEDWMKVYYHPVSLIFLGILGITSIIFYRKNTRFFNFLLLFLFIEIVIFIALQFWTFRFHDYYTINMYILPVFIIISSLSILNKANFSPVINNSIKLAFTAFLIFNIFYAGQRIRERYQGKLNNVYYENINFYSLETHLRSIGIHPDEKVISFSDFSHVTLYLMDQKGWTRYIDMRLNRNTPVPYNNDSAAIQQSIEHGAKYLIINGFDDIYSHSFLHYYTRNLESFHKNILIFDLANPKRNFEPTKKKIKQSGFCSAERLISNDKVFLDSSGLISFGNIETRTVDFSLSGNYSVIVNGQNPYGMTFELENLKHGESVNVRVWKKGPLDAGRIVAQADDYQFFNRSENRLTGRKKDEWVEIELEFFIPFRMDGKGLKIYLHNSGEEKVYFDDLGFKRYLSVIQAN